MKTSSETKNRVILRKSTAVIVLVIQFVLAAAVLVAWSDITQLRAFDRRREYDICLGSNRQIERAVDRLVQPAPTPPNATEIERETTRLRNERSQASQEGLHRALEENRAECRNLLVK